jgi:hypothetical protein
MAIPPVLFVTGMLPQAGEASRILKKHPGFKKASPS